MATADQIKSLLLSHYKNDRDRFTSIALQVAAHEARKGHMSIAKEIKALIDKAKTKNFTIRSSWDWKNSDCFFYSS